MASDATTSETVASLFAEAADQFEAIIGQPTDSDLHALREILYPILLDIPYDCENGTHNLVGLITKDAAYQPKYGSSFVRPPALGTYDNSIANDANNVTRAKAEAKHRAKLADRTTYVAAERETRKFIISKVEDTWIRELKDAETFYTEVLAVDILAHLQGSCLGKHETDAVSLLVNMQTYHVHAEGVPEYINMLEDAQRTALCINPQNPITDQSVLNIAVKATLKTGQFPRANEEWEDLEAAQKTWQKWKMIYKKAQGKERVRMKAADAAAAKLADLGRSDGQSSEQSGSHEFALEASGTGQEEPFSVADLEACFDNLANAAKAERETLDELVRSNAALTKLTAELVSTNKKLANNVWDQQRQINSLKKGTPAGPRTRGGDHGNRSGGGNKKCKHCNRDTHTSEDCWELPQNATKRPEGWNSCL